MSGFATAPKFVIQSTPTKHRIFRLDKNDLAPVTTVDDREFADQLREALNLAAWTGDRGDLTKLIDGMESTVRRSILDGVPAKPHPLGIDAYGFPLEIATRMHYLFVSPEDLAGDLTRLLDASVPFRCWNHVDVYDDDTDVSWRVDTLTGETWAAASATPTGWPTSGLQLIDRMVISETQLVTALDELGWRTHPIHIHSLVVGDTDDPDGPSSTQLVVEQFTGALPVDGDADPDVPYEDGKTPCPSCEERVVPTRCPDLLGGIPCPDMVCPDCGDEIETYKPM